MVCPKWKGNPIMSHRMPEQHKFLEITLILICVALCCLLYRVGDYRVLLWVDHSKRVITLHTVGHRSEVYRRL